MPQADDVVLIWSKRFQRIGFQQPTAQQERSDQQPQIPVEPDIVPPVDNELTVVSEVVVEGFDGGLKHGRGLAGGGGQGF